MAIHSGSKTRTTTRKFQRQARPTPPRTRWSHAYTPACAFDTQMHAPASSQATSTPLAEIAPSMVHPGGECGPRAWFGRFTRRAFGLPVWGIKEPGHAAMTTWSPRGWAVLLGAGWDHGWWDSGRSGSDFVLETQCREYRSVFQKVLRGQWAASARGEVPVDDNWTPRVPGRGYGQGGLWGALMLYLKKTTMKKYGPAPARPIGKSVVPTKVRRVNSA